MGLMTIYCNVLKIMLGLLVIEKFNSSQGSLKNAEHQFLDRFYFITFTNVNWFLVTIAYFNRLIKIFQRPYHMLKSIKIRTRYQGKICLGISNFKTSHPHRVFLHFTSRARVSRTTQSTFPRLSCCQTCMDLRPKHLIFTGISRPLGWCT